MVEPHREEIEKLEALYAENPEGRVFTHLAEAYRRAGELDRAREIVEAGLKKHADYSSAHVVMGRIRVDQRQNEAAAASFRRVIELDPHNLVALKELGDLARQAGRVEEAVEYYRELLALDPTHKELSEYVAEHTESEAGQAAAQAPAFGTPPFGTPPFRPAEPTLGGEDEAGLLDLGEITGFGPAPEAASGFELGGFGSLGADEPSGAAAQREDASELGSEPEPTGEPESGGEVESAGFWSAVGWDPEPASAWEAPDDQALTPDWSATETGAASEASAPVEGGGSGFEDESAAGEEGPADESMVAGWNVEAWGSDELGSDQLPGETAADAADAGSPSTAEADGWAVAADVEAPAQDETMPAEAQVGGEAGAGFGGDVASDVEAGPSTEPQPETEEVGFGFGQDVVAESRPNAAPAASEDAGPGGQDGVEAETDVWSTGGWESPAMGFGEEEVAGAADSGVTEGSVAGADSGLSADEAGTEAPEPEEPWAYSGEESAEEEPETLELMDEVLSGGSRDISFSEELVPESAQVSEDEGTSGPDAGFAEDEARDSEAAEEEPLFADDSMPAAGVKDEEEMVTETMADLYLRQGFHRRAVEVYRELLRQRPADTRLEAKLSEAEYRLESQGEEPAGAEGSAEDRPVEDVEAAWTGRAGAVGGDASPYAWAAEPGLEAEGTRDDVTIGHYLSELLAWQPRAGAAPAPAASVERAEPSPPPGGPGGAGAESGPDGAADDEDLEMFRAWLQSLKR